MIFFLIEIEGIGTPDIGPWIVIGNPMMALLNGILAVFFLGVIFLIRLKVSSSLTLAIILAGFDILAEILFHGFGYITVSLVVAMIIIGLSVYWKKNAS